MKILVLSFYFRPDLSAGSFRVSTLMDELSQRSEVEQIDVVTTYPNRYATFREAADQFEQAGKVRINRLSVPQHKSGMGDQVRSFATYAFKVIPALFWKDYDLIFVSSSRLMTAFLGAGVSVWKRAPLYLDIRDIFTDTMKDLHAHSRLKALMPIFSQIERFTLRRARRVNVVSEAFIPHFHKVAPDADYGFHPNGIDTQFLDANFPLRADSSQRLIVCAGNIGDGQGLHHIIPQAARALGRKAHFRIIGDGGRRRLLEQAVQDSGVTNIEIIDPVPRHDLLAHYTEADVLFLHLNDVEAFQKVLPSKIFEYAATGRPVIAGVNGYSKDFLMNHVPGSYVFHPNDPDGFVAAFGAAVQGPSTFERGKFKSAFGRSEINRRLASDIIGLHTKLKSAAHPRKESVLQSKNAHHR